MGRDKKVRAVELGKDVLIVLLTALGVWLILQTPLAAPLHSLLGEEGRQTASGQAQGGDRVEGALPLTMVVNLPGSDRLPEGAEGVTSPEKALLLAGGPESENLWIIGGGSIYAALLSRCHRVYLTRVETRVEESDTFFPNLDKLPNWEMDSAGELIEENGLKFRFLEYVNTKPSC